MGSVSLGNDQATHLANFEQDQFASVGNTVGVADVEEIAPAIKITKGGNIFDAWPCGNTRPGRFTLCGDHIVNSL